MKATVLDLLQNPGKILDAIDRNETVTLTKCGREIALIVPKKSGRPVAPIKASPAFGLWKDRTDMADPVQVVRKLRKERRNAL